jgi:hypothetical protein
VIGGADELQQLTGLQAPLEDLHKSEVDAVVITRVSNKDGKEHQYKRVPDTSNSNNQILMTRVKSWGYALTLFYTVTDVLDVWVDAGSASWNALHDATAANKVNSEWFPIDLILGTELNSIFILSITL